MRDANLDKAHRVVSSDTEQLILVDIDDNETGYLSKASCHDGEGVLHRAFSLFLFDQAGRLLLQRRASTKRLWPGYWSNSCCSHPRRGESMRVATGRRLRDELNVESELEFVYKFRYQADFDLAGAEHELCHVYLGRISDKVRANEHEIAALRFVSAVELRREFEKQPELFTPWFKMEWQTLISEHADQLAQFSR
jgi:isopentenyl-diphosphate delta-isomerase